MAGRASGLVAAPGKVAVTAARDRRPQVPLGWIAVAAVAAASASGFELQLSRAITFSFRTLPCQPYLPSSHRPSAPRKACSDSSPSRKDVHSLTSLPRATPAACMQRGPHVAPPLRTTGPPPSRSRIAPRCPAPA